MRQRAMRQGLSWSTSPKKYIDASRLARKAYTLSENSRLNAPARIPQVRGKNSSWNGIKGVHNRSIEVLAKVLARERRGDIGAVAIAIQGRQKYLLPARSLRIGNQIESGFIG